MRDRVRERRVACIGSDCEVVTSWLQASKGPVAKCDRAIGGSSGFDHRITKQGMLEIGQ